ncbi:MAG: cyanophycinase [Planctomycetaceae bacterium]
MELRAVMVSLAAGMATVWREPVRIGKEPWFNGRRGAAGVLVAVVGGLGILIVVCGSSLKPAGAPERLVDRRVPGGSLMIDGGGCITPEIRQRFVELAGGPNARIVLIPGNEPQPGDDERALVPWKSLGVAAVEFCHARCRELADDPAFCERLRAATGVWFGGGLQEFLAERYVDTAAQRCLHELLERHGVVGGCSAGAALLSQVMIVEGEIRPVEARGLGLISNAIVDQHFLWRNRLFRLQRILQSHPELIGLGVDERTALVVEVNSSKLSVVGDSYAMVCLPESDSEPARIEVLKAGDEVSLTQLQQNHLVYRRHSEVAELPGDSGQ